MLYLGMRKVAFQIHFERGLQEVEIWPFYWRLTVIQELCIISEVERKERYVGEDSLPELFVFPLDG